MHGEALARRIRKPQTSQPARPTDLYMVKHRGFYNTQIFIKLLIKFKFFIDNKKIPHYHEINLISL